MQKKFLTKSCFFLFQVVLFCLTIAIEGMFKDCQNAIKNTEKAIEKIEQDVGVCSDNIKDLKKVDLKLGEEFKTGCGQIMNQMNDEVKMVFAIGFDGITEKAGLNEKTAKLIKIESDDKKNDDSGEGFSFFDDISIINKDAKDDSSSEQGFSFFDIPEEDQLIEDKLKDLKKLKKDVLLFFENKQYSRSPKDKAFEILEQLKGKRHSSKNISRLVSLKTEKEKSDFQCSLYNSLHNSLDQQKGSIGEAWDNIVLRADSTFCSLDTYQVQEDSLKSYVLWFFDVIELCPRKIDHIEKINVAERMNNILYKKKFLEEEYDYYLLSGDLNQLLGEFEKVFAKKEWSFTENFLDRFFVHTQEIGDMLIKLYCRDKLMALSHESLAVFYENVRLIMQESFNFDCRFGSYIEGDVLMPDPTISLEDAIKNFEMKYQFFSKNLLSAHFKTH